MNFKLFDKEYNIMIDHDSINAFDGEFITFYGAVVEKEEEFGYDGVLTSFADISDKRIVFESTGIVDIKGNEVFFGCDIIAIKISKDGYNKSIVGVPIKDKYGNPKIHNRDFYFTEFINAQKVSIEIIGSVFEYSGIDVCAKYGITHREIIK